MLGPRVFKVRADLIVGAFVSFSAFFFFSFSLFRSWNPVFQLHLYRRWRKLIHYYCFRFISKNFLSPFIFSFFLPPSRCRLCAAKLMTQFYERIFDPPRICFCRREIFIFIFLPKTCSRWIFRRTKFLFNENSLRCRYYLMNSPAMRNTVNKIIYLVLIWRQYNFPACKTKTHCETFQNFSFDTESIDVLGCIFHTLPFCVCSIYGSIARLSHLGGCSHSSGILSKITIFPTSGSI